MWQFIRRQDGKLLQSNNLESSITLNIRILDIIAILKILQWQHSLSVTERLEILEKYIAELGSVPHSIRKLIVYELLYSLAVAILQGATRPNSLVVSCMAFCTAEPQLLVDRTDELFIEVCNLLYSFAVRRATIARTVMYMINSPKQKIPDPLEKDIDRFSRAFSLFNQLRTYMDVSEHTSTISFRLPIEKECWKLLARDPRTLAFMGNVRPIKQDDKQKQSGNEFHGSVHFCYSEK